MIDVFVIFCLWRSRLHIISLGTKERALDWVRLRESVLVILILHF